MNKEWYNIEIHVDACESLDFFSIKRITEEVNNGLLDDFTGDKCHITDITQNDIYRSCFYMESIRPIDADNMSTLLHKLSDIADIKSITVAVDCYHVLEKHFTSHYWNDGVIEARQLPVSAVEDIELLDAEDRNERIQVYIDATNERLPYAICTDNIHHRAVVHPA